MQHIKEILAARKVSLFEGHDVKGSREWSAFNAVRDDRIEMFPVAARRTPAMPRYTNIVHINRYPSRLTPRIAQ